MIRRLGTVRNVSAPFDCGKWIEVKIALDDGHTQTFICAAQDADDWPIGQACAVTIESLLN